MRFSLGTLVLAVLLISTLLAVVLLNEPWVQAQSFPFDQKSWRNSNQFISPDGTEKIGAWAPLVDGIGVFENREDGRLLQTLRKTNVLHAHYVSVSEIVMLIKINPKVNGTDLGVLIFRRRFQNTFLGHATRAEVVSFFLVILVLVIRMIWQRHANAAGKDVAK